MRTLLCVILLHTFAFAKCYYSSCVGVIQSSKESTISAINSAFDAVDNSLNQLDQAYSNYNDQLHTQNELLAKLKKIKAYNVKNEKEISFLLSQNNQLESNFIDALIQASNIEGIDKNLLDQIIQETEDENLTQTSPFDASKHK